MVALILDLILFALTFTAVFSCFRTDGHWDVKRGLNVMKYYTVQSNILCAITALTIAVCILLGGVPRWAWLLKYIGTAAVTVTFMTVMVYLGPAAGYKKMFSGADLHLHLFGPLLAIVSFCFFERFHPLSFPLSLTAMIPVVLYGLLYMFKVICCPAERRWDDFYHFNDGGRWPLSFAAMIVGTLGICAGLYALCRL